MAMEVSCFRLLFLCGFVSKVRIPSILELFQFLSSTFQSADKDSLMIAAMEIEDQYVGLHNVF